jgi:hypothetical protein
MLAEQQSFEARPMRAIRIHQTGGPEVLKLEEVELPKPGKGEVRLRQHAVGINYIDVYFRNGFYPAPARAKSSRSGRGSRISSPATGSHMSARSAPTPRSATSRRGSSSSCRAAFLMTRPLR